MPLFEVRIQLIDHAPPSVAERRHTLDTHLVPQAEAFFAATPYTKQDIIDARARLAAAWEDAAKSATIDANGIVTAPADPVKVNLARLAEANTAPLLADRSATETSIAIEYEYHDIVIAEAAQSDADMQTAREALDRLAYKAGHIVDVHPSGHPWTVNETNPQAYGFVLVDVPAIDEAAFAVEWITKDRPRFVADEYASGIAAAQIAPVEVYVAPAYATEQHLGPDGKTLEDVRVRVRRRAWTVDMGAVKLGATLTLDEFSALMVPVK